MDFLMAVLQCTQLVEGILYLQLQQILDFLNDIKFLDKIKISLTITCYKS